MNIKQTINQHAASMKNPPKGYGSIDKGIEVNKYRRERLDYWAKQVGKGLYTTEVRALANKDVLAKYGLPV